MEDDQIQRIKYMKDIEGFSFRRISQELPLSRKTVAKLYSGGPAVKRAPTGSKHGLAIDFVDWHIH